jgi:hypothetical protein
MKKGMAVLTHFMTAYGRAGNTLTIILNIGNEFMRVVSFTAKPSHPRGSSRFVPRPVRVLRRRIGRQRTVRVKVTLRRVRETSVAVEKQ